MKRLIEWDSVDVRVDGEKLNAIARQTIAGDPMIEKMEMKFSNALLRVEGTIKKIVSIPFTVDITHIEPKGTIVRVPLARISAGKIPIPSLLIGLIRNRFPKDLVTYEDPATLVITLDRFLPPFLTADVQKIWIIDGGLAVTLGKGGADMPRGGKDV
jgi:hypothetical protein